MYKLLALDLDGTLLNENHEISEKNKIMINKARKNGVRIILISGREPNSIKYFSEELGLEELIGGFNGGIVTDNKVEKTYFNKCIQEELSKKTIYLLENMGVCSVVFAGNKMLAQDVNDRRIKIFKNYAIGDTEEVGHMSTFLEKNNLWGSINKIILSDSNEILNHHKDILSKEFGNGLTIQFSLPFFLEIFSNEISKGKALDFISDYYGIDSAEIIAIGDGENDIDMLKYAGLGVAMGNAPESVKEIADIVTLPNNKDGVSNIIEKFIVKE